MLDKQLEEYRELVAAITETFTVYIRAGKGGLGPTAVMLGDLDLADPKTLQVIRNRVLISREIKREHILKQWTDASRLFDHGGTREAFTAKFHLICNKIVNLAIVDSEKRDSLDDIFERIRQEIRASSDF